MSEKQTILIVDDITANIQLLNGILGNEHRILFATSGHQALEMAQESLPDLILLDIMMPDMNGYEVCEKLKSTELTRHIPVIFLTALNDRENETEGLRLGAIDYIRKPYSPAIVQLRVRNHLELKKARDDLFKLSNIDRLTGIANRKAIFDFLEREIARAVRQKRELGFIMLDIDFFKKYNDNYGHVAGDGCLNAVAQAMEGSLLRPGDMIGRYGGEEFLAVLPEITPEGVLEVGERLLSAVRGLAISHGFSEAADHVTISAGCCSLVPTSEQSCDDLVILADKALYMAKAAGRDRLVFSKG